MIRRLVQRLGGVEVSVALLCALAGLAGYSLHPSRLAEARSIYGNFWRELPRQGISLDGAHCLRHLETGQFTPWTHMVTREALMRWRVRNEFPGAWDTLHERWQTGLWECPPRDQWEAAFRSLDAGWKAARAGQPDSWRMEAPALAAAGWTFVADGASTAQPGEPLSLIVRMPETPTAALGADIVVEGRFDGTPRLYWTTNRQGLSGFQSLGPVWLNREGGRTRARFRLSGEPGWLAPGTATSLLRLDVLQPEGGVAITAIEGEGALRSW